ncbi:hypothetical protein RHSIM_Rhsim06G0139500 [Rhododendron simsii]|uniref:RNA polymerase II subunit 5-mediating protein homolog n=1 Tax=Rhododendron simsii TaxID=118357 RepID=A0A834GTR5_RHOSS|nr:hypothetical protein RHSIM_Rhsim06G0139500 [Rhododendron simsii]
MDEPAKGTVTSLSSLFPAEEVREASKRVLDTISEHRKDLDKLRDFTADNASLISLVQKLPDQLHHDIMASTQYTSSPAVPFGKAAFFPGRLIHTNEFLVLLGEGYYAERTSKQTIDLLKRRGKALESQVNSITAVMQDLKAQASYFDATAAEVAEGLVDITEEYIEETSVEKVSKAGSMNALTEEEEFAKLMSKIDELEKEELAEESDEDENDEEYGHMMSKLDELEKKELATESVSESDEGYSSQYSFDQRHGHQLINPPKQSKDERPTVKELPSKQHFFQQELHKQFEGSKLQSVSQAPYQLCWSQMLENQPGQVSSGLVYLNQLKNQDPSKSPSDRISAHTKSSSAEKALVLPEVGENIQAEPYLQNKAFTGAIVEHSHNLETNPREQTTTSSKSSTSQPSKPVSRFKMQRR